jgi:cellulose synthase (UDP-forming)
MSRPRDARSEDADGRRRQATPAYDPLTSGADAVLSSAKPWDLPAGSADDRPPLTPEKPAPAEPRADAGRAPSVLPWDGPDKSDTTRPPTASVWDVSPTPKADTGRAVDAPRWDAPAGTNAEAHRTSSARSWDAPAGTNGHAARTPGASVWDVSAKPKADTGRESGDSLWDILSKPKADTSQAPRDPLWDTPAKPKADANGAPSALPWDAPAKAGGDDAKRPTASPWDAPPDVTVIGPPLTPPSPQPLPRRAAQTGAVEARSPQAPPPAAAPGTGTDDIWPSSRPWDLPAGNADDRAPLAPPKPALPKATPPKPARPEVTSPRPVRAETPAETKAKADTAPPPTVLPWEVADRSNGDATRAPVTPSWKTAAETKTRETKTGETNGTGRARAASPWDAAPDATLIGPPLIPAGEPEQSQATRSRTSPAAPPRTATDRSAARPAADRSAARPAVDLRPADASLDRAGGARSQPKPRPADTAPAPVLPLPPRDKEKYGYVRRHLWVLTLCSALSFPPLVYSQVRMVVNSAWFAIYAPFALFGIFTFLLSLVADGMSRAFDLDEHKRIVAGWMPLWYPSVDVFLPVCGEPLEVLHNAWTHVAALRSQYQGQVIPWVLDDSANPEIKAMARRFGFAYATRPDRGRFKKSGNLRYGFSISDSDYILLLDADFAPRADLLDETLPYMDMFPDVGIVQTPQFFRVLDQQTWVERGAGAIQELFYRSIQTARARKGGSICVGSCAVYRRSALEENRGMSLAEHSEDLHTGFDLYKLGWKLRYLPVALSTGNCPDNVLAFLNQQYRWCSGTMSLLRSKKFWQTKLPLYMRLCYLTGFVGYVYTAVFTFVAPMLAVAMLLFVPGELLFRNLIFIAPVLFYAGVIYPMWHRAPYRLEAWSVRVISGWAHLFAFWDMLRGRLRGWQPSGSGATKQDGRRRLWIGLVVWSFGSALAWSSLAFWRMITMDPYNFFLVFVLGVFQLVVVGRILVQPRAGRSS